MNEMNRANRMKGLTGRMAMLLGIVAAALLVTTLATGAAACEAHAKSAKKVEGGAGGGGDSDGVAAFGKPITLARTESFAEVVKNPTQFAGKAILIEGQVSDVCQKKGCWMMVSDGSVAPMRVEFEGYSFFVPKTSLGKKARLQGTVANHTVDAETAQHWADEAGVDTKAPVASAEIKGESQVVMFTATGVELR